MKSRSKSPRFDRSSIMPKLLTIEQAYTTDDVDEELKRRKQKTEFDTLVQTGGSCKDNPELHRLIVKQRADDEECRRLRSKGLYSLDSSALETTFVLPGRPPTASLFASDNSRSLKRTRKLKVVEESIESVENLNRNTDTNATEFGFLASALGTSKKDPETGLSILLTSDNSNNRTSSIKAHNSNVDDIDEIEAIMATIKTGEDAMNFFARY